MALSPLGLKQADAEARAHHRAFLAGGSVDHRPCLYVIADAPHPPPLDAFDESIDRKARDMMPEWHIHQIGDFLFRTLFLADAMPAAQICIGRDVTDTAVLIGGDYDYRYGEALIRRQPELLEAGIDGFDPGHPLVRGLERVYRAVAHRFGRQAYLNNVMSLDALTTMSQILGPLELCADLVERPQWVIERVKAIQAVADRFYLHFHDLQRELGHGETSSWFNLMVEGRFDTLRSDFAAMISPDMFRRFAVPELTMHAACLDHSLFNMDSVRMIDFLDSLADIPGMDGIYWNPEPKEAGLMKWIDALRDIRRRGLLLHVQASTAGEAVAVTRELGPDGLLVALPRFSRRDEAERAVEEIARATL